jgi:hypothetical protein
MKLIMLVLLLAALVPRALDGQSDPQGQLFIARGCSECHAVVGLGIKAKADVAPDLTYAYGDVLYRYGLTLERFFEEPAGAMRMVLGGGHVQLSQADRDALVRMLRVLYGQGLAKRGLPGCKEGQ